MKFEIFNRLNSGSVALNAQELRNCVYRGSYNDLLRDLSHDKGFVNLMEFNKERKPDKRMRDVEHVLRFSAFYFGNYLKYYPPMKKFMNNEMRERRDISDTDAAKLTSAFMQAVSLSASMFGKNAFLRFIPGNERIKKELFQKNLMHLFMMF